MFRALPTLRYLAAVALTAVSAGLIGRGCAALLHTTEAAVHQFSAVSHIPVFPLVAMGAASVFAALVWFFLFRQGWRPLSARAMTERTLNAEASSPSLWRTWAHSAVQIVFVGAGASIGREVAPREMSASLSVHLSRLLRLSPQQAQIIVASAAGAGLAAVYSLPLSGALLALETLLVSLRPRAVLTALTVSVTSVWVATGRISLRPFYGVPAQLTSTSQLQELIGSSLPFLEAGAATGITWLWVVGFLVASCLFCSVLGFLSGVGGEIFGHWVSRLEAQRPHLRPRTLLWLLPLAGLALGAVLLVFPEIAGNGQLVAQTAIDAGRSASPQRIVGFLCALGAVKAVATLMLIRAGAWGGTLTPAIAIGAAWGAAFTVLVLHGAAACGVTSPLLEASDPSLITATVAAGALIGGAAFLGISMRAPVTAVILILEFTGASVALLPFLAVAAICAKVGASLSARGFEFFQTRHRFGGSR